MSVTNRLDAFTDAAFAFAVTLLVAGGQAPGNDYSGLQAVVSTVLPFSIGFAIIGMFWFAHVRWRTYRGEGDWRSVLLTFLLVFAVLIYIHPLRVMSLSFADFLTGQPGATARGSIGGIFTIYGVGFVLMALVILALFGDARRNPALDDAHRRSLVGEQMIWAILVVTGLVSIMLAQIRATAPFAPVVYSTLPITIGLFVWRWFGRST